MSLAILFHLLCAQHVSDINIYPSSEACDYSVELTHWSYCSSTDYGLDGPGSSPGGDEIFRPSRSALGLTQPPVKWVPGFFPGVKCGRGVLLTTHPFLVRRSWKSRAIPLPTLWATPGL